MKRAALAVVLLAAACGGRGPNTPKGGGALAKAVSDAIKTEQTADTTAAADAFAKALDMGVAADGDPWQPYVVAAAIDHLAMRQVQGLGAHSAIADRLQDPRTGGKTDPVMAALRKAAAASKGPFARGLVAWAGQHLAETRGDAKTATEWRTARGCALEAMVIGPLHWAPVSGVSAESDPLERADAKLEASYVGHGPFAKKIEPTLMKARGCWIELEAQSALGGVRDVVVDVDVPEAQTIGVALRTESTATLRVGGRVVIDRPYDLGGDPVMRLARVDVGAGRLRLVARVGADQAGESIAIHVWNADGMPLATHAPKPGDVATNIAKGSSPVMPPPVRTDDERVTVGAGALALGEARTAERALFDVAGSTTPSANALIVYARAIGVARDLSAARRAERGRTLWEKVLERWPGSWEAIVAHAELAGDRKGRSEARIEALRDLDAHRTATGSGIALLDTYDALTSGYESIYDRSGKALERAKPTLGLTTLFRDADRAGVARSGVERVAFECNEGSARAGDDLLCYDALSDTGDLAKAETEMQRVRSVRGAETAFLPLSLRAALVRRDDAGAKKIFASMPPGERTFAAFASLEKSTDRAAIGRVATVSRDAPTSIAPMLRWLGQEPVSGFEEISDAAVKEDQAKPVMPEAGTAIVRHIEKFDVDESGLLHVVMLDLRRVGGTTDVEENAQALPPDILGKGAMRSLRRRIFKKDGRVLAPDPTPNAAQAHADLAQLEKGDHIESVYEAWALPANSGDLGADTPDMLPERTAIAKADIEVKLPASLKVNLWSHPLLGKPVETKDGSKRVLTWKLENKPTRRNEEGTPKMDRAARVSWTTAEWANVSRGLREVVAALDDHDVEVESWARQAGAGKAASSRELVETIVSKAGEAIRESSSGLLSDYMLLRASGPQSFTARTILSDREGSRTLVIIRALRILGVSVDLGVAENEPYSADPSFPPHFGRFTHPLAVAHVTGKDGKPEDVWIDADVSGPPLPAGRVSPELRGRTVLLTDGKMISSPLSGSEGERDEIDLRITLDENGDAKGTLTVLLRGRASQEISEALLKVVGFERERALRNIALAWLPFADIENVVLSSSEGSWQVALRADVSVKKYAQPEGKGADAMWVLPGLEPLHTVFPRPWVTTLAASYAGQGARQEALAISRAVQYHTHRLVQFPKSANVVRQPSPLEVRTPNLAASRKIKVENGALDEEFLLSVTTGTVAADKYAAFVGDAQRIDAAFLASTRVKPGK